MATIVRTEKRKRGIFGTLVWWVFLAFNALMALWLFFGLSHVADQAPKAASGAEQAGMAIGGAIAAGMLLSVWLIGALILGLIVALTRGKTITIEKVID